MRKGGDGEAEDKTNPQLFMIDRQQSGFVKLPAIAVPVVGGDDAILAVKSEQDVRPGGLHAGYGFFDVGSEFRVGDIQQFSGESDAHTELCGHKAPAVRRLVGSRGGLRL